MTKERRSFSAMEMSGMKICHICPPGVVSSNHSMVGQGGAFWYHVLSLPT